MEERSASAALRGDNGAPTYMVNRAAVHEAPLYVNDVSTVPLVPPPSRA